MEQHNRMIKCDGTAGERVEKKGKKNFPTLSISVITGFTFFPGEKLSHMSLNFY